MWKRSVSNLSKSPLVLFESKGSERYIALQRSLGICGFYFGSQAVAATAWGLEMHGPNILLGVFFGAFLVSQHVYMGKVVSTITLLDPQTRQVAISTFNFFGRAKPAKPYALKDYGLIVPEKGNKIFLRPLAAKSVKEYFVMFHREDLLERMFQPPPPTNNNEK